MEEKEAAKILRNPNASREEKSKAASLLGRKGGKRSGDVRRKNRDE
jgi:hypothetical protein